MKKIYIFLLLTAFLNFPILNAQSNALLLEQPFELHDYQAQGIGVCLFANQSPFVQSPLQSFCFG